MRLSSFDDACTDNEEFVGELPGACTYPPMINNAQAWQLAKSVAATIVGAERVQEADATMGGEDFGYFMRHIPGVFVLIGSGSEIASGSKAFRLIRTGLSLRTKVTG